MRAPLHLLDGTQYSGVSARDTACLTVSFAGSTVHGTEQKRATGSMAALLAAVRHGAVMLRLKRDAQGHIGDRWASSC